MAKKIDLKPAVSARSKAQDALSSMLGGGSVTGRVIDIDVDLLVPWSSEKYNQEVQPFDMYSPDELEDLANSIKRNGIQQPIIVRPLGDKYQILAGHNRTEAAKLVDLKMVPAIVRDVDEETAMLIVVDTNLNQRQEIKPSTKAHTYQLRNDIIAAQGESSNRSTADIAQMTGENLRQVQRYLRLNHLTPDLLKMVDEERISVRAGVSLSYLKKDEQAAVVNCLNRMPELSLQIPVAEELKRLSKQGRLDGFVILQMLKDGQTVVAEKKEREQQRKKKTKVRPMVAPADPVQETPPLPTKPDDERIIHFPFSAIEEYFKEPNPSDEEVVRVIKAHFEYMAQKFNEQFMSIYNMEKMMEE